MSSKNIIMHAKKHKPQDNRYNLFENNKFMQIALNQFWSVNLCYMWILTMDSSNNIHHLIYSLCSPEAKKPQINDTLLKNLVCVFTTFCLLYVCSKKKHHPLFWHTLSSIMLKLCQHKFFGRRNFFLLYF
jgi:hypothetical protein